MYDKDEWRGRIIKNTLSVEFALITIIYIYIYIYIVLRLQVNEYDSLKTAENSIFRIVFHMALIMLERESVQLF